VSGVRAPTPSGYRGRGMDRIFAQIAKNYHAVINCFDNGKVYCRVVYEVIYRIRLSENLLLACPPLPDIFISRSKNP
jgi:hypothetical protein